MNDTTTQHMQGDDKAPKAREKNSTIMKTSPPTNNLLIRSALSAEPFPITPANKLNEKTLYKNKSSLQESKSASQNPSKRIKERYGINAAAFDSADLNKWANDHNYKLQMNGAGELYYTPKRKGAMLGLLGGKKLTSDEEDADLKVLTEIAHNNERKKLSQNAPSENRAARAATAVISGIDNGAFFGLLSKSAEKEAKKKYLAVGLPEKEYVSGKNVIDKIAQENSVAETAGEIAGSLALFGTVGETVRGATQGIKWLASAPDGCRQR